MRKVSSSPSKGSGGENADRERVAHEEYPLVSVGHVELTIVNR